MRLVVKVGSSSLVGPDGWPDSTVIGQLCLQIRRLMAEAHEVVLVSSGAVATGSALIGARSSNRSAQAAVGQAHLMGVYRRFLGTRSIAQVLVLKPDLEPQTPSPLRYTLEDLWAAGVLPVVNENDVVSRPDTELGENDRVAALLARLVQADVLVLLSDVDGVYETLPGARGPSRPLSRLDWTAIEALLEASPESLAKGSSWGRGGMRSKLEAAMHVARDGIPTVIAHARQPQVLLEVARFASVGTWIGRPKPTSRPASAPCREEASHGIQ